MSKGLRWESLAVPLSWLAELDNCAHPDDLADAFGDGYLCARNPVFAGVRRSALALGYRYSAADTPMWRDYQAFGLSTLHQIIASGIIPYHDTGSTIQRLLKSNSKAVLSPGIILSALKRNYAFHESAHCVAWSVLHRAEGGPVRLAANERERFVIEAILAESFANTVEMLGSLVRTLPLSDTLFYSLNSYMTPKQDRMVQLQDAVAAAGEYARFLLLFLGSFEANLTVAEPGDATRERIGLAAGRDTAPAHVVRMVTEAAFRLNPGFREKTTPMYFELLGYKAEYQALTQTLWLDDPGNREFIRNLAPMLFAATGQPVAGRPDPVQTAVPIVSGG